MGSYLHKINGQTIQATNIHTGNKVEIALAPYWIKPYSHQWEWFDNINRFDENFDPWEVESERREREINRVGLFRRDYNRDDIQLYWHFKRRYLQAKKWFKELKARGVEYVILFDIKRLKQFPNEPTTVYTLNDFMFDDDGGSGIFNGNTENMGTFKYYGKGRSVFHPQREIHAIPMFR